MKKTPVKQSNDTVDLRNMDIFEALHTILISCSPAVSQNKKKVLKIKSDIPNFKNIVREIPITAGVEYV